MTARYLIPVTLLAFVSSARGDNDASKQLRGGGELSRAPDNVWTQALDGGAALAQKQAYDRALADGDAHVQQANACMVSPNERRRQIDLALESYKKASAARPTEGEPHYRSAEVLDAFYVCSSEERIQLTDEEPCRTPRNLCTEFTLKQNAPRMIAELEAFEAASPRDPRLSVISGASPLLFSRALTKTRLATRTQLEGAAADYEKILARTDGPVDETVVSNLAETYMMLDRLDEAIDNYQLAMRSGGPDAAFGLAVALDRNGQTDRALGVLRAVPNEAIQSFHLRVQLHKTFFVPFGEVYYYEAMIEEARGNDQLALENWRAYVKSNAHPEFQPNANAHIATILKRLAHPTVPTLREYDEDL